MRLSIAQNSIARELGSIIARRLVGAVIGGPEQPLWRAKRQYSARDLSDWQL